LIALAAAWHAGRKADCAAAASGRVYLFDAESAARLPS
jgi:hypothetical protein